MKKMLTALLTLTALSAATAFATPTATPTPQAAVMADSRSGDALGYDGLLTECAWQGLALPAEAMVALGDPGRIVLTVEDLSDNVKVALRPARNPGLIGLKVSRSDRRLAVHQMGRLTLTNPLSGYSYSVQALITGDERAEK